MFWRPGAPVSAPSPPFGCTTKRRAGRDASHPGLSGRRELSAALSSIARRASAKTFATSVSNRSMCAPPVLRQEHVMQSTVRPDSGHSMPTEYSDMGSVASIAAFSRSLVRREQFRSGGDVEKAIQRVAGRLKIGPGTIANLVKNRVKSVCFQIASRIIAAAISDIENERKQLEHERELLLAVAAPANPADLAEVEAHLEEARAGLARMRGAQ